MFPISIIFYCLLQSTSYISERHINYNRNNNILWHDILSCVDRRKASKKIHTIWRNRSNARVVEHGPIRRHCCSTKKTVIFAIKRKQKIELTSHSNNVVPHVAVMILFSLDISISISTITLILSNSHMICKQSFIMFCSQLKWFM